MSGKTPLSDVTSELLPLKKGRLNSPPFSREGARRAGGFWIEFLFWLGVIFILLLMYKFVEKDSLIYVISQTLPSKEAGMLSGILWGDKSGFSSDFYKLLQTTGIVHIVVVSGTNVMLLSILIIENLAYVLSRKRAIVVGMCLIWWYALTVGLEPPVLRAGLLLSLFYGAQMVGRKFNVWRALGLVFGVMIMADWRMIISLSFWLSMAAYIGVITKDRLPRFARNDNLVGIFLQTIWISLWVTPILAITFGRISIISPVINALVLGLVQIITVIGLVGSIVHPVLWLAYPFLHYVVWLVELAGKLPWATVSFNFNWWLVGGWYLILFYFLIKKDRFTRSCGFAMTSLRGSASRRRRSNLNGEN